MKKLEFSSKNATLLYNRYIDNVRQTIKSLPEEDKDDILMEVNSHIYESMQNASGSEVDRMIIVLEKLGNPHDTYAAIVADRKLSQATRTFNPIHILKALSLNISNGFIYVLFSFLYLFSFCFVFLIFAKLLYPNNTGLFLGERGIQFGFIVDSSSPEILGIWFIPVVIIGIVLMFFLITFLMKLQYKLKKRI